MDSGHGNTPTEGGLIMKHPSDFISGLKLPKLDIKPRVKVNRSIRKGKSRGGSEESNSKVRLFKSFHNEDILGKLIGGVVGGSGDETTATTFQSTGLFGSNSHHAGYSDGDDEGDHQREDIQNKVKGFIGRRKKNRVDQELHTRISKAYDKMEFLEKGVRSFDDTLLLAKGRLVEVGRKGRATLGNSPRGSDFTLSDADSALGSARSPMLLKSPKDVLKFGLGMLKISETKPDYEASREEVGVVGDQPDEILYPVKSANASTNLSQTSNPDQRPIPTRLRLHERSGNKGLEHVRSKIQVLKMKSESEDRKSKVKRPSKLESTYTGEGNLTRLMVDDPNQGPAKELMDFLQAHGGSTGGWDKEDHDIFLVAYLKWKHMPSEIIRSVSAECSGRRMQEVAAHLDWYETYERLNAANKAYVRQWKINKRRERQQMYRMARQEAKAKIEGEKSRQEMIKAKREVEKERERVTLNDWKKSKKAEVKKLEIETDMLRDPDGAARTTKLGENLQLTKERLVKLLPPAHQLRKILTKSRIPLELKPRRRESALERSTPQEEDVARSTSSVDGSFPSEPSSSVELWDALTMANQTGKEKSAPLKMVDPDKKLASKIRLKTPGTTTSGSNPELDEKSTRVNQLSPLQLLAKRSSEKMLAYYRDRDEKIVSAKLNAIRCKKESQKNKAFLSTEETKERISQIKLASTVTRLTKGIKLRQNIRELEAIGVSVREELKKSQDLHLISRVPTPQMFKTGPTLNSIPKLGAPAWRKS